MKTRFLFLTSLIFLSSFAGVCSATYIQWDGGAGTSDWNNAVNWNLDTIPGITDKAGFKTATGAVVAVAVPTFMQMTLGGNGGNGILTVQPGAVINCTDTWAMGQSSNETGVLNISGGGITVGNWFYAGNAGTGMINMSGGSITITGLFSIAYGAGATSSGTVNLDGGTITAATFSMAPGGGTARLNITGGKLVINGNVTGTIVTYITNTWIKGYGSASNVRYDYDVTTSGKTTVWAVNAVKATNPSPANGVTDVARNATLSWTGAAEASSHNVYFGTASPSTFQINQTGTTFNPGQLAVGTTYYWRIDEVSGPNTITGDVWSFITVSGQAKNPDPTNIAANVAFDKILRWTAGPGAASHDVYFGTTLSDVNNANRLLADLNGDDIVDKNDISRLAEYWLQDPVGTEPYAAVNTDNVVDFIDYALLAQDWMNSAGPVFKGNQDANSFNPGLALNTTYYWRIDEVNGPDTAKGAIWSFTTQSGKAFSPSPANSTSNVATSATLSWTAGAGAASHDVYFGTANPPPSIDNRTTTTYNPGTLANSTTYYWQIDEVGGSGTITGDLWSFTTVGLSTTPVYPYLTWRSSPTNSVVVNWWNPSVTGDSTVDYGPTNSYGSSVNVATVTNYHHVELTGLATGTTYHYRIRSNDGTVGVDNTFTTAAANATSFGFAAFGDGRGIAGDSTLYYARHQALCDWIAAQNNIKFVLDSGDIVWEGASTTSLVDYWPDYFQLESNLSKSKVKINTLGNHEVQPTGAGTPLERYQNYKNFYAAGFPANGVGGNYEGQVYSFNYGNAHIVCLSSFQAPFATQTAWLAADLAAASADPSIQWIFAFMHSPMYTTSSTHPPDTGEQVAFGALFDQYHVDIVFSGHNHVYERSKSIVNGAVVPDGQGTVYITNGLAGANFDPISSHPLFVTEYNLQTLATCVTIDGNNLMVNSITNADEVVHDTFTLSK